MQFQMPSYKVFDTVIQAENFIKKIEDRYEILDSVPFSFSWVDEHNRVYKAFRHQVIFRRKPKRA